MTDQGFMSFPMFSGTRFVLPILFGIAFCLPSMASAQVPVVVPMHSQDVQDTTDIGNADVKGLGPVRLVATRKGKQVIVQALVKGEVIGKAETFIGIAQTPLFLQTPSGLKEIIIFWGQSEKQ